MRIASSQMFTGTINSMLDQQARLAKTQEQLATGNRISTPADDPIGSVRAQELNRSLDRNTQYESNTNILDSRLRLEEETVSNSIGILQRVRDLALQANSPVHTQESIGALVEQLRQEMDSLLAYANTRDNDGRYIFGGYQDAAPFADNAGSITYQGDDGQRQIQVAPARVIPDSDPGSRVFMGILDGNGRFAVTADGNNAGDGAVALGAVIDTAAFTGASYSIRFVDADSYELVDGGGNVVDTGSFREGSEITAAGMSVTISGHPAAGDQFHLRAAQQTDVFSMLESLASTLESVSNQPAERGVQTSEINSSISNIDQAINKLISVQSNVGARLGALETQVDINTGANLRIQESLSEIKDLDYAKAISLFNQQMAGLQAAQQVFGKVQNLSLFNYL